MTQRSSCRWLALLCLVAESAMLAPVRGEEPGPNLLRNGGFEEGLEETW